MLMHFEKKTKIGKGKTLLDIAEAVNVGVAKKYALKLRSQLASSAALWRQWAKVKLSSPCATKNGPQNSASGGYPGRCSGLLERSLGHRTYTRVSKSGTHPIVKAGAYAEFVPFTVRDFNYGEYHNDNIQGRFFNFKQKIYKELSKRVEKLLQPVEGLQYGGFE